MTLCVVEGCGQEYDVTCSFSFYNVNTTSDSDDLRQEWIEGALQEDSECLWRHVSLQLCSYHFESDQQGLWIESPVLPELLTVHEEPDLNNENAAVAPQEQLARLAAQPKESFQSSFADFVSHTREDVIRMEHNYSSGARAEGEEEGASRLNVRHLVDALGYLSFKNLQRKQLWVVNVEAGSTEASVTQTEQVIAKMQDTSPKQIIELIPPNSGSMPELTGPVHSEVLEIMEETTIPDNFIYEIAEEQEIRTDETENKEIPYVRPNREYMVNIFPEESRPKYAFIKHCTTGKKRKHFMPVESHEVVAYEEGADNLYILPDADPSVGVEITTSYEPNEFVVDEYQQIMFEERPRKRSKEPWEMETPRRKKKKSVRDQIKKINRAMEHQEDWQLGEVHVEQESVPQDEDHDSDSKKGNRVRRKNKRYTDYDFVT